MSYIKRIGGALIIRSSFYLNTNLLVVLLATLGSLFFSEILGYPPCVLCWYQRIFMYPLVVIFAAALWADDDEYFRYAIPLSALGLIAAIYHNLIYYGLVESIVPCEKGVSCSTRQVEYFGFLTIPLMALLCFTAINILSGLDFFSRKSKK